MPRPPSHVSIDVRDRREADAIVAGLEDPEVRAFVVVMGALSLLVTDRARARVLNFVMDSLQEKGTIR